MPSLLGRLSLRVWAFVIGGFAWSGLVVANGMLWTTGNRYVGNPLYTLTVGVAVTATVVGIQLQCHVAALRQQVKIASMGMHPTARQAPTAFVGGAVGDAEVMMMRNIESEMRGWIARDMEPPSGEVQR